MNSLRLHPARALLVLGLLSCAAVALAKPPPIVPEAMLEACAGKQQGAPCTVTLGGETKKGACVKLPDATLACMQPRKR